MSKNTDSILVQIDFWILDTIFQPLANLLPGEKMNLRVYKLGIGLCDFLVRIFAVTHDYVWGRAIPLGL